MLSHLTPPGERAATGLRAGAEARATVAAYRANARALRRTIARGRRAWEHIPPRMRADFYPTLRHLRTAHDVHHAMGEYAFTVLIGQPWLSAKLQARVAEAEALAAELERLADARGSR